jgi:hypothetical protein
MHDPTPSEFTNSPHGQKSPLRENWSAIVFMIVLLLASGITASVAGYRIKLADKDRKAQLFQAYEALGGTRGRLINIEQSMLSTPNSPAKTAFLAVYETNERARSFGLYRTLEFAKPPHVATMVAALNQIGSADPARIIEETWKAMLENPATANLAHPDQGPMNPKAARISKKYSRYAARDVETKLFKFYTDHKAEIIDQPK